MPIRFDAIIPSGKSWIMPGADQIMRRRYQGGTIFKRGKRLKLWVGRWYEPALEDGKLVRIRRSEILGECAQMTKSHAEKQLEGRLRLINEGLYGPVERCTFAEFCDRWEREVLIHYRESTRKFYKDTLARWVRPYFNNWNLAEIRPADAQRFINQFGAYSHSVIKHVRAILSVVFDGAVRWQYVKSNPCAGMVMPAGKEVKRARALAPGEVRAVIGRLKEPYRTMVTVMALAVIRETELLALKWTDVDFEQGLILVQRSLYRGVVGEPKSKRSRRVIPATPRVIEALLELRRTELNRGEYVFTNAEGKFCSPDNVQRRHFDPAAEALEIERFTWRSFRRMGATELHDAGIPLQVQREIMGHTREETSLIYTVAKGDTHRAAMEGLADKIMGVSEVLSDPNGPKLLNGKPQGKPI